MRENRPTIISRETLLPISIVITMFMAVWFLATLTAEVQSNKNRIDKIENKLEQLATKEDLMKLETSLREIFSK